MAFIDNQLLLFKQIIENAIVTGGAKKKESVIKSSSLINLIHDAVKNGFINAGISPNNIFPHFNATKPELKIAGYLKQKDQDICIVPSNIEKVISPINWGPLSFEQKIDNYGFEYSRKSIIINVRSQMSSLAKNYDTLFERTFAEALNLHMRYTDAVLGEVYLIPTHEYDSNYVKQKQIRFMNRHINLEKYISFFNAISNRPINGENYLYEKCALLIVDFNRPQPYLFKNSEELKELGYISDEFPIEYANLNFDNFFQDILQTYSSRFDINNLRL